MKEKQPCSIFAWLPNFITALGLICGLISIIFAIHCNQQFGGLSGTNWAWIFIGGAALFDFMDGFCARLLNAYSELGKNLDSLCDLVSFGVAPAILIYNLISVYHPHSSFVTWLPLIIPVCGAFRLAKFNIDPSQKEVFMGLPIPANAIFWVGFSPMLIIPGYMPDWVTTFAILGISLLMVSPLPMFSLKIKNFKPSADNILRLILICATIALVICLGISGLMWTILVYLLLSFISFVFLVKEI